MENFRNYVSIGLIIKLNNNVVFLYIKKNQHFFLYSRNSFCKLIFLFSLSAKFDFK